MFDAFQPAPGAGQTLTTGGTSVSVSIDAVAKSIRIVNTGTTNAAYVRIGSGTQTATAADSVILPSSEVIFHKGDGDNALAHLQHTGATTLHIQTGEGGS